jgi:hypothetical protein
LVIDPVAGVGDRAASTGIAGNGQRRVGTGALNPTLTLAHTLSFALSGKTAMGLFEQKAAKCGAEARVISGDGEKQSLKHQVARIIWELESRI